VVRAFRFGAALQRRKLFLRLVAKADGMALAEREELRAYAAKRFGIKKRLF
jgi:hypothetical protein